MNRAAIVLDKNLNVGQKANVSAILMGQMALKAKDLYYQGDLIDLSGTRHSGVQYSTVLLEANSHAQIINLIQSIRTQVQNVFFVVFSAMGQTLNNEFDIYKANIESSTTEELVPVGIALFGDEDEVRKVTKKFSLLK